MLNPELPWRTQFTVGKLYAGYIKLETKHFPEISWHWDAEAVAFQMLAPNPTVPDCCPC